MMDRYRAIERERERERERRDRERDMLQCVFSLVRGRVISL